EQGELEFQEYFVRYRWQPGVQSIEYRDADKASVTTEVRKALYQSDIILFAPSNPWLSIAPILAIPEMRKLIQVCAVPRVAVTPIIAGQAVKGPLAKLMGELGYEVTAACVATFYGDLITGFVYDQQDVDFSVANLQNIAFDTMMNT